MMKSLWGILLGVALFFVGLLVYLGSKLGPLTSNKAVSINLLRALTIWNLWFWVGLVFAVAAGLAFVRLWSR